MTNTNADDRKLAANFVWVFAAAALGVAIVLPKIMHFSTTLKGMSAIFALTFAALGAASTLLARAGGLRAASAFTVAGLAHAVYWFITIKKASAGASGVAAGLGAGLLVTLTVAFGVASIVGGIGGTLFGLKVRRNLAKTARVLAQRSQR